MNNILKTRQSHTWLDLLLPNELNSYLKRYISVAGNSIQNANVVQTLIKLMMLRSELYRISGVDMTNPNPQNVINHVTEILRVLFSHKELGYISPSHISQNPVISSLLRYYEWVTGSNLLALHYKTSKP